MVRRLLLIFLLGWLALPGLAEPTQPDLGALRVIPVQDNGRLKPLDTVARETVRHITGKANFHNEDPVWTHLRWIADPKAATAEANIECRNLGLKKALELNADERWFSVDELQKNPKLQTMQTALQQKGRSRGEMSDQDKELEQLIVRVNTLMAILNGDVWKIVPHPTDMNQPWQSPMELQARAQDPKVAEAMKAIGELVDAAHQKDYNAIQTAAAKLGPALAALGPTPPASWMNTEVQYNNFHPFQKAWALYFVGLCLLIFAHDSKSKLYYLGMGTGIIGFALHTYGFYLRCSVAGRPPVTNMYESVIWAAYGAVLFALIFEALYRARYYLMAAEVVAIVALVLADNLPAVLDPSIKPLTPVLRNNFWLTIHVLTITASYAAFALALGLGHGVVWTYAFSPSQKERISVLNKALYKAVQVGVLLLAAGTILGGVWANYSWGRFWGWDPKEVWALIALLGYLALLHGRYAGWLRSFGLAAGSILAFQGVMMAWYGVNYVLGAGLHSYGFGTGGLHYVVGVVAVDMLFVAFTALKHRHNQSRPPRPEDDVVPAKA